MALDATVGGPDADSYVTLEEADAYFEARLFTATWDAADDADKEAALKWAARIFESKISANWTKANLPEDATIRVLTKLKPDSECFIVWNGSPASTTQALAWPRTGMVDGNGNEIASNVIPQRVKDVQCELAALLMASDRTLESAAAAQGLSGLKAGPVELRWRDGAPNPRLIPDSVMQLLVPSWWYAFELMYQKRAFAVTL